MFINEDIPISFRHFTCAGRDEINGCPRGIADKINAILNRVCHGGNVGLQLVDTFGIFDGFTAVFFDQVVTCPEAVFDDH